MKSVGAVIKTDSIFILWFNGISNSL